MTPGKQDKTLELSKHILMRLARWCPVLYKAEFTLLGVYIDNRLAFHNHKAEKLQIKEMHLRDFQFTRERIKKVLMKSIIL